MPRDLFGDVTRPSISIGNRKWYTVPVSLFSHAAIVIGVVVVPLVATDVLPAPWQPMEDFILAGPTPPPPPPPRPLEKVPPPQDSNLPPTVAPDGFTPEKPVEPREPFEFDTGIVGGDENIARIVAPPPEVKAAPPQPPVRVGSTVRTPQKLRDVHPVYPAVARAARVEGTVIIEATIGIDGRLVDTRILRSIPLLDQAALDAVRQWEFTPSLLNGVPVPVIMTVTVTFKLQ